MPHALVLFGIIYGTPLLIPCDDLSCLVLSWLITAISISDSLYHAIPVSQSYSMDSDIPKVYQISMHHHFLCHTWCRQASSNSKPFDCSTVKTKELLNTLGKRFRDSSFRTKIHWLAPNAIPALPRSWPSDSAHFHWGRLGMLHKLLLVLLPLPSYGWTINYIKSLQGKNWPLKKGLNYTHVQQC